MRTYFLTRIFTNKMPNCREYIRGNSKEIRVNSCQNGLSKIYFKRGVSLIEVLVTIIILSVGLTAMIRSFMMSIRASHLAKDYTIVTLLIQEKMFDYEAAGKIKADLDEEGEFPEPNSKFSYELTTEKKSDNEDEALNLVNLTVSWQEAKRTSSISVVTLLRDDTD